MKLKKVWAVYFSGTGTTRRTVERIAGDIAARLGLPVQSVDFSRPALRQETLRFSDTDLVVFGTPVYAGRVPNVLLPFLQEKVVGGGALAVPVVLFGNRNYDDALMELRNILIADGLHPIAAGAFVGEHSFSRVLGQGRPNAEDAAQMDGFAARTAELVSGLESAPQNPVAVGGAGAHPPLLYAPGPGRKPHQYIKGKAQNGSVPLWRLRPVRRAVPHGLHRPGGCVAGQGHLHQVLCLRQGLPHRGQVLRRRGVSLPPARTGGRIRPPGGERGVLHTIII